MSSFLIEKIESNIKLINDITDEKLLDQICNHFLSKNNKNTVSFLIQNDKIPKTLSLNLFKFIVDNNFWDLVLNLDYNKFDLHVNNDYLFICSIYSSPINIIKFLVEKGSDIHIKNDAALQYASEFGRTEIVKFLIEKGANIHANNDFAFRISSEMGHIDVVKILVENGADIHVLNDTSLKTASFNGYIDVVKFLICSDIEYFKNNEIAIKIVKKHNLDSIFEKYEFLLERNSIVDHIKTENIEFFKKYDTFDFSKDEYYCFFKALDANNTELTQIIFNKIQNKDDLLNIYNKISLVFDENTKNKFNHLYKNDKLNEIKLKIDALMIELKELQK